MSMRKHRKAKQRRMNDPITQLIRVINRVNSHANPNHTPPVL